MNKDLMFSSKTDLWSTPIDLFKKLQLEFEFTLDVCATKNNAKCKTYYTKEIDGLKQDWKKGRNESKKNAYNTNKISSDYWAWMNPPYGRETGKWVKKAAEEKNVVALLPARTDTKWFHDHIYGKAEIRFIKGRLKFGNATNSAPFPSMICIFR